MKLDMLKARMEAAATRLWRLGRERAAYAVVDRWYDWVQSRLGI
jgi:hypothetical protein